MKRRAIDRFLLLEANVVGAAIDVHSSPSSGAQASFKVEIENHLLTKVEGVKDAAEQLNKTTISLNIQISNREKSPPEPHVSASVRITGTFMLLGEHKGVSKDEHEKCHHDFARILFPLARSELARMLSRAKIPDVPLVWDLGPDANESMTVKSQRADAERS
jgi:preprotein translocase subunit SecB